MNKKLIVLATANLLFAQTTAEKLGYGKEAKLLIINADDFGMCHAENMATIKLLTEGYATSATVMVPMPGSSVSTTTVFS